MPLCSQKSVIHLIAVVELDGGGGHICVAEREISVKDSVHNTDPGQARRGCGRSKREQSTTWGIYEELNARNARAR